MNLYGVVGECYVCTLPGRRVDVQVTALWDESVYLCSTHTTNQTQVATELAVRLDLPS